MAQNNVLPPITITTPRPPDFNFGDFSVKANDIPGANPGAGIPAPTVCFNQFCTSNYMLHFANMGNMIRATEMFLKHLEVFGKIRYSVLAKSTNTGGRLSNQFFRRKKSFVLGPTAGQECRHTPPSGSP
ncbi:hypothetical protein [Burkholderia stabilis]|uniref:hypothetical protein n=1 Tax=Burkholderia stabilis TaxID=95485 RepID=UPI0011463D88|nr:hypothetical protein [Burkholderia stabilis]